MNPFNNDTNDRLTDTHDRLGKHLDQHLRTHGDCACQWFVTLCRVKMAQAQAQLVVRVNEEAGKSW